MKNYNTSNMDATLVCLLAILSLSLSLSLSPPSLFQVKKGGGLSINSMVTLTHMSEKMAQLILHEYSILNVLVQL